MEDHVYFFTGNCQTQYLAAMIGAVSSAERSFVGHRYGVNLGLDGPLVPCVEKPDFFKSVHAANAEGKKSILFVLETAHSRFMTRIGKKQRLFSEIIRIPHMHFRVQWPKPARDGTVPSERLVKRTFDYERHEFLGKLQRCGMENAEDFAAAYWEKARTEPHFYHPAHQSGRLLADVLEGLRPVLAGRLPAFEDLLPALRRSEGIYQNSLHPVSAPIADLLDLAWAKTDMYRAWIALQHNDGSDAEMGRAVARAREILSDPDALGVMRWPYQSHFQSSFGMALLKLGQRDEGVAAMEQSTIALKGHGPLVRRTMTQAVRAGRADVIENLLVSVAPHLDVATDDHPGYQTCFQSVLKLPTGRETLVRVQDQIDPKAWVHRYIQSTLAAAA